MVSPIVSRSSESAADNSYALTIPQNMMLEPSPSPDPGLQGIIIFPGEFVDTASRSFNGVGDHLESSFEAISTDAKLVGETGSEASQVFPEANDESSKEPLQWKTEKRACDRCRKSKICCGSKRASKHCQGPRISRYRLKRRETPCTKSSYPPSLLDAAGDVPSLPRKEKGEKGRPCRWCSRHNKPCEDFEPCSRCVSKGWTCRMPTRPPHKFVSRKSRALPTKPKVMLTADPKSSSNFLRLPSPPISRAPGLFDDTAIDTQVSSFSQGNGFSPGMTLALGDYGGRCDEQDSDLGSPQSYSMAKYGVFDMGQAVVALGNDSSHGMPPNAAMLSGSHEPIFSVQLMHQAWSDVNISESPFVEFNSEPQPQSHQLGQPQPYEQQPYGQQMFEQQMYPQQMYEQQPVAMVSMDAVEEVSLPELGYL